MRAVVEQRRCGCQAADALGWRRGRGACNVRGTTSSAYRWTLARQSGQALNERNVLSFAGTTCWQMRTSNRLAPWRSFFFTMARQTRGIVNFCDFCRRFAKSMPPRPVNPPSEAFITIQPASRRR